MKSPPANKKPQRVCVQCGELYDPGSELASHPRRFCSRRCTGDYNSARAAAAYPPKEEFAPLYAELGLSDRVVGARYGRSYTWAMKVRRHYGITAAMKKQALPRRRKVNHGYMKVGKEYEHRVVMVEKLGRPLRPGEVVHHIDGDKANNDPENLALFTSNGSHCRHEAKLAGKATRRDWATAREKVDAEGNCRVCGSTTRLEAAHVIPRSLTQPGPDQGESPDNIVPLCGGPGGCHARYDDERTLDLLPYLTLPEQACAVRLHPSGLIGALRRVTNERSPTVHRPVYAEQ